jgi:hypothetical protein
MTKTTNQLRNLKNLKIPMRRINLKSQKRTKTNQIPLLKKKIAIKVRRKARNRKMRKANDL